MAIYMWRDYNYTPWDNTILYCPLKDDIEDKTWNHTMSLVTSSYGTVAKDSTGFYKFTWWYISSENYIWPTQATLSVRVKRLNKHTTNDSWWWLSAHYKSSSPYHYIGMNFWWYNSSNGNIAIYNWNSRNLTVTSSTIWTWELRTITYNSIDWLKYYKNWNLISNISTSWNLTQYNWPTNIWATFEFTDQFLEWYLSDVIYESIPRTADEIQDYYNWTKALYGIS